MVWSDSTAIGPFITNYSIIFMLLGLQSDDKYNLADIVRWRLGIKVVGGRQDLVNQQLSFELRNIFCWNKL